MPRTLLQSAPWPASSFWNRNLPSNAPLHSNSSAVVSDLVAQVGATPSSTTYINEGGGPVYVVNNSTPKVTVRWQQSIDPTLIAAVPTAPFPSGFITGNDSDKHVTLYNQDTDELWEFWKVDHTLLAPQLYEGALASQCTFSSGGSLPAGTVYYPIVPFGGDVTFGQGDAAYAGASPVQSSSAGQKATFSWGTSAGATRYDIWRVHSGIAGGAWQYLASVSSSTHSYTDTGAASPGNPASSPAAVFSTPSAQYGGYMSSAHASTGRFESPHSMWGATATSLPMLGGAVLINEGLAKNIPHALCFAIPHVNTGYVWPAQRADQSPNTNSANNPQEGMCFRLPATYDVSGISNLYTRALAKATRDYGMYLRDGAGSIGPYAEDPRDNTGITDKVNQLYGGQQLYDALTTFPWSSLQVVDPTFLKSLAGSPTIVYPTSATITSINSDAAFASGDTTASITVNNSAADVPPFASDAILS